ncbi:YopX family protein [Campylobacter lari]|uniref:YopX family protein n=1 Tax=Campylobacter lari TaxID=201 RepID=UPI0021523A12|nr:YopX family protein [Campylobacter lari]MCR6543352.1 YopX family protein [Campylobacter lari]
MKLKDFDFRIWDNHNKKYIDNIPYSIKKYQNENEVFLPFSTDLREYGFNETFKNEIQIPSDRVEVELWTGFYDKNGKKIYENDIITLCHFAQKCIGVVRFGRNGFVITSKDENAEQGGELSYFEKYFYNFEVVGNIHENHI